MSASRGLLMFLRAAAAVQLILGIGFWTGHWSGLVNLHMAIGSLFVLALWVIAGIALARRTSSTGLAVFAIVWGLIVMALGMTQRGMLVGDYHWVIRVVHLVVSVAAVPLGERLAAARVAA